ncbi:hypothetical protein ILYODFUR_033571 [Ilyodon furcidens]|uniref:Uncharacterized protein n=1 Tax=Ilyodon furcidens TaxID=33524 RepID=A0ABV0UP71_9TELE
MVAQLVALLPCSEKILSSTPGRSLSAWSLHVLPVHAWVLSGYSGFLPQSKDMTVRLIGLSKLALGVNGACTVVCPACLCVALRWTGDRSRVHPASCPQTSGDRHQHP